VQWLYHFKHYNHPLSSSSLFTNSTLTQAFLTFKTLFNTSLLWWLLIFGLLTPLRLNSCSSDSKTNLPKYTTLHLTRPTLLEILASSLTNVLLSLTKLHLSPKPVIGLTSICQLPVPLLPLSFTLLTLDSQLKDSDDPSHGFTELRFYIPLDRIRHFGDVRILPANLLAWHWTFPQWYRC